MNPDTGRPVARKLGRVVRSEVGVSEHDTSSPIDPDDPRLDAFVEALACALLDDLASHPTE